MSLAFVAVLMPSFLGAGQTILICQIWAPLAFSSKSPPNRVLDTCYDWALGGREKRRS